MINRKIPQIKYAIVILLAALFACSSLQAAASPQEEPSAVEPSPDKVEPIPDKSVIIIKRTSGFYGGLRGIDVVFDNSLIGKLGSGEQVKIIKDPGMYPLRFIQGALDLRTWIEAEKNKIYKINFEYKTGKIWLEGDEKSAIKITSDPPGATIFAGSSPSNLQPLAWKTPYALQREYGKSFWAAEYYQVRLDGYQIPEPVYKINTFGDRVLDFKLIKNGEKATKAELETFSGTGWITANKYIITNNHLTQNAKAIAVSIYGYSEGSLSASVVLADEYNDLAILKLDSNPKDIPDGLVITGRMPVVGEEVFTIGFPRSNVMGNNPKITNGIISALSGIKDDPRVIQTTTSIQPGNSGGPLINLKGEVVGVTTSTLRTLLTDRGIEVPQNVNYAVKSAYVIALLTNLNIDINEFNKTAPRSRENKTISELVPTIQKSLVQIIVKR